MKKVLLILCLTLTGCSGLSGMATDAALGAVGLGTDKSGLSVDTEIVAGDKEQEVLYFKCKYRYYSKAT
jgi:hypothetical protein